MATQTPNIGLDKPTVGGDIDLWGPMLNSNADKLDSLSGSSPQIATIAAMRLLTTVGFPAANLTLVNYSTTVKGGGGAFFYDSTDTTSLDDGATIILDSTPVTPRRWKRSDKTALTTQMAGLVGDGTTDDADAAERFFNVLGATGRTGYIHPPAAYYRLSRRVNATAAKPYKCVGVTAKSCAFVSDLAATNNGGIVITPNGDGVGVNSIMPFIFEDFASLTKATTPAGTGFTVDMRNFISPISRGTSTYGSLPTAAPRVHMKNIRTEGFTSNLVDAWQYGVTINCGNRLDLENIFGTGKQTGGAGVDSNVRTLVNLIARDFITRTITNLVVNTSTGVVTVSYTGTQIPLTLADTPFVFITGITGMPELDNTHFRTGNHTWAAGSGTFTLTNTDGREWGPYGGGGTVDGSPQQTSSVAKNISGAFWNKSIYCGQSEGLLIKDTFITAVNRGFHMQEQQGFEIENCHTAAMYRGAEANNVSHGSINNYLMFSYTGSFSITVTAVTQAATAVVTYSGNIHPTADGYVKFTVSSGMTQLNNNTYRVKNLNAALRTFELWDSLSAAAINSTAFTAFTSGTAAPIVQGTRLVNSPNVSIIGGGYDDAGGQGIEPIVLNNISTGATTINGTIFEDAVDGAVSMFGTTLSVVIGDGCAYAAGAVVHQIFNDDPSVIKDVYVGNQTFIVVDAPSTSPTTGLNIIGINQTTGGGDFSAELSPTANLIIQGCTEAFKGRKMTFNNGTLSSAAAARLMILEHDSPTMTAGAKAAGFEFLFPDRMPRLLMPGESIRFFNDGSAWIPQDLSRFLQMADFYSDLFTADLPTGATGTGAAVTSSSYQAGDTTFRPFGIQQLATGTTATGGASLGEFLSQTTTGKGSMMSVHRVALEVLSTGAEEYVCRVGIHDADSAAADVTDGVYWEYDRTLNTFWQCCTANAGTRTKAVSGQNATISSYRYLGVFINGDATRADFFRSNDGGTWVFEASIATNIPVSPNRVGFGAQIKKTVGTTSRNLHVDFSSFQYQQIRGTA
jgi:hypothetical protein